MKKRKFIPLGIMILLIFAFSFWRRKAPSYEGQELHATLEVGDDFEVLLMGDMGSGDAMQLKVASAMNTYCETHKLSAVIFLGDNFYPAGVKSVDDPQWQSKFLTPYSTACLSKIPFYAVLGNHDYKGNPSAQVAYHGQNPSWIMPHRFYDLKLGKLLTLTMIDTNILDFCASKNNCTIDFMLDSLKNATTPYKIVVGHHPMVSSSGKYTRTFQGNLLEKLLCDRSAYYIAGHSHHLEHLTSSICSMDMFVVGGGGADLYDVKEWTKETLFAKSSLGFMTLHVKPESLTFRFFDPDLTKLYEVEKKAI